MVDFISPAVLLPFPPHPIAATKPHRQMKTLGSHKCIFFLITAGRTCPSSVSPRLMHKHGTASKQRSRSICSGLQANTLGLGCLVFGQTGTTRAPPGSACAAKQWGGAGITAFSSELGFRPNSEEYHHQSTMAD